MRIISGTHKGKRIVAPKKLPVRPTTDMAKEALFNILNNAYYFQGIRVLDLCSGTGNISYEFASRGCTDITAVDNFSGCVRFISKTASQLNFSIKTVKSNVFKFLEKGTGLPYDIIFADPPYDFSSDQFEKIIADVFEYDFLSPEGTLIIEHSKHTDLSKHPYLLDQRKYGGNIFSFFGITEIESE